jgi:hypothetical protein
MCFSQPKIATPAPTAPTPTAANTGASETTAAENAKQRKGVRTAAGFSQNILSGDTGSSATVDKKSVLG